jgi:hypothetical protein
VAASNNRIIRVGISVHRAAEYLMDLGCRAFDADSMLYHAELWARRQGSQKPIYPLRAGDPPAVCFDVWTESVVGDKVSVNGKAVAS